MKLAFERADSVNVPFWESGRGIIQSVEGPYRTERQRRENSAHPASLPGLRLELPALSPSVLLVLRPEPKSTSWPLRALKPLDWD